MVSNWSRSFVFGVITYVVAISVAFAQDEVGFVEAEVDNLTPYVGEPIVYTVRLFDAGTTTGKQYVSPTFASFGQIEGQDSTEVTSLNGRQYTVISQNTILIPLIAGTLVIDPAQVVVPETALQSGTTLTSLPTTVEVQPLPPDPTGTFGGAIGQFTMSLVSNETEYRMGEPFTLQLVVEGTGNLEQTVSPGLTMPNEWRFFENPSVLELVGATSARRTFEWAVIPASAGERTIEPIVFTYFDPQIDNYRSISSARVTIAVAEGDITSEDFSPSEPSNQVTNNPLTLRPMNSTVGRNPNDLGIFYWLLWAIPLIFVLGVWFVGKNRSTEPSSMTASQARKRRPTAKGSSALKKLQQDLRKAPQSI